MQRKIGQDNNSKIGILAISICIIIVIATIVGFVLFFSSHNPFSISKITRFKQVETVPSEEIIEKYENPLDMHAIWVMNSEINDKTLDDIKNLEIIDAIIFDTPTDLITTAKNEGYKTYLTYDLSSCVLPRQPFESNLIPPKQELIDSKYIDNLRNDLRSYIGEYKVDGVILDGFYNVIDNTYYETYLKNGGAMGYDNYRYIISESLIKNAKDVIEKIDPKTNVGLLCEATWANDYEDKKGSKTKGAFSSLIEGNCDTVSIIENDLADFIVVKAYTANTDSAVSFENVVSWWDDIAKENDIPLYIAHAAFKAASSIPGWTEYDQIARQVIYSKELSSYCGSVFNSLGNMKENPEDFAQKLIGYYQGTVKQEHIMQDLEIVRPSQKVFTTNNLSVTFAGNTDPNTYATINEKPIKVDENGYFQFDADLVEGVNTFEIYHKGQTQTYTITRITEIVKSVSPAEGTINVDGETEIEISAVAYRDAEVYAIVNGTKVTLKPDEKQDDSDIRDSAYIIFTGVYKAPSSKSTVQKLGKVEVFGTWSGMTKSKLGAEIIVNERALPSDGQPIRVIADLANLYNASNTSNYADSSLFPLPKGSLDYALGDPTTYTVKEDGETFKYTYYKLQSGVRVLADDIEAIGEKEAPVANNIIDVTISSDEETTKVILDTEQKVSFVAKYTDSEIKITFNYTDSLPDDLTDLTLNPLFSSITFKDDTMTLKLRQKGHFVGYNAHFDRTGDLVLEFKNPHDIYNNGLNNVNIVIDPGHGGKDVGALGFLSSHPESVINYDIATYLREFLENYGANVTLIPTDKRYYTLDERMQIAEEENADLFISIHNNSAANGTATGSEAYYFNAWSSPLSVLASDYMSQALNSNDRGGKYGLYYVTRTMRYPAVLVEGGFVSTANEYNMLVDSYYQQMLGENLGAAIIDYLVQISSDNYEYGVESTGINLYDAGR